MADTQANSDCVKHKVECLICKGDKNTTIDLIIKVD